MEPDRDLGATLRAETVELPESAGRILDLDLAPDGRWVALVEGGAERGLLVRTAHGAVFPVAPTPRIAGMRVLPDDRVLVFDARGGGAREENARIYAPDGRLLVSFSAGSDLTDAIVLRDLVVFGYGDRAGHDSSPWESVFAAFDFDGNCRWRYRSALTSQALDVFDVYAMCRAGSSSIWAHVHGDDEFDLVRIDLLRNAQETWALPEPLSPVQLAIDPQRGGLFRNHVQEGSHAVFHWTPWRDDPPEPLGTLEPHDPSDEFRATPDGRSLLHIHSAGFTTWSW